jgi:hypothetical protein
LRYCRTSTAKHVRFAPDSLILNVRDDERHHLLDYKVTQTPIYSRSRLALIREAAADACLTAESIGQIEADALDNYLRLCEIGVRTAVLDHCAYHERTLLCEYADRIKVLHRDRVTTSTDTGSGTPFINLDCRSMRTLAQFLADEHDVHIDPNAYAVAANAILETLPITRAIRTNSGAAARW